MTVDRLLTVKDVAARLGLSPVTVYGWIARRRLPFVKFGASRRAAVRISESVLTAFVAAQTVPAWPGRPSGRKRGAA